ncbi:MAG: helix-turn-helix domain-containing protein [Clostridiales bacterium]|nr:helix-turn-helix domain-containing protein [Clostridiales bacterium]
MATKYTYDPRTDLPVAPGETIREILEERGILQADFAVRLGKTEKFVSQLVNGRASLTHDTAIELERVLGVPSSFWNKLESIYRDALAHQRQKTDAAAQAEWAKSFPLKVMESHGWIARETGSAEQAEELLRYFGVATIDAYQDYWGADKRLAARMSTAYTAETPAITAWLRAGERQAEGIRTEPFNEAAFREVLGELRSATSMHPEEWQPIIVKRCAAAGVAVVFVPDLPRTRCHAVSWWANRSRAVIQLGLRYKTDDQLWFSFFHEAGHVLLDERRSGRISDLNGDPLAEERANAFAADFLIPPENYEAFRSQPGRLSKTSVKAFAEEIGIAPSILVGRLQREGVIPFSHMNALKTKLDWTG